MSTLIFFFFNDPTTTEIYTLSLHDALPILPQGMKVAAMYCRSAATWMRSHTWRSEEQTSELQSQSNLVCRLLLEKKKHAFALYIMTNPKFNGPVLFIIMSLEAKYGDTFSIA